MLPRAARAGPSPQSGGKLADPEKFKRELHPFDGYRAAQSTKPRKNEPPKPDDNFRWRFFGLFYCAPAQKAFYVPAAHSKRHPQTLAICPGLPISPSRMPAATPT